MNYFDNRRTNALAESFNAKIKVLYQNLGAFLRIRCKSWGLSKKIR
ncbi:hypothetical protein ACFP6C_21010 [Flavobacterium psychroterrae]